MKTTGGSHCGNMMDAPAAFYRNLMVYLCGRGEQKWRSAGEREEVEPRGSALKAEKPERRVPLKAVKLQISSRSIRAGAALSSPYHDC